MPLDASIYGNIQPPANLLTQYSNALGVANQMQQNQLLQTQNQKAKLDTQLQQAQMVAGQILTDHINPDGTTDFLGATQDPRYKGNPAAQPIIYDQMAKALAPATTRVPDGNGGYVDQPSSVQDALVARNREAALGITRKLVAQGNQGDITDKHLNDASVDLMTDAGVPAKVVAAALPNMPEDSAGRLQAAKQSYSTMLVHKMQHVSQDEAQGGGVYNTQASPLAGKNVNAGVPVTAMADISANQQQGQDMQKQIIDNGQSAIIGADAAKEARATLNSGVTTGKMAPWTEKGRAYIASIVGEKNVPDDTNDAAKMQVLAKQLATVQAARGEGDPTDLARLNTASQNADITKVGPAIAKVLQYGQGQFEAKKSKMLGMQATLGANPTGMAVKDYDAKFNAANDPAVFRYMLMSPEDRKAWAAENFAGAAGEKKKAAFLAKADALKNLGALNGVGQ